MKGEKLELSYCNLNDFFSEIVPSFDELTHEKGIVFSFNTKSRYIYANIDRVKLKKILNNLLSNALKFTPKGGHVELSLSWSSSENTISKKQTDRYKPLQGSHQPNLSTR